MQFDKAAAIGHFANTVNGTVRLVVDKGEAVLHQGDSYFAAVVNAAGGIIDNPGGSRTWGGSLRSGRRVWGPEGSEALDRQVTRPDATAKTFGVNIDNVAPEGDTLIVSVTGTGPRGVKLENLPGANVAIRLEPAGFPGEVVEADPLSEVPARVAGLEAQAKELLEASADLGRKIEEGFEQLRYWLDDRYGTAR